MMTRRPPNSTAIADKCEHCKEGHSHFAKANCLSIFGVIVSLIIIIYILHIMDFSALLSSFGKFNPYWTISMAAVYLFGFLLRGLRWRVMLSHIKLLSIKATTGGIIIGYMGNNVLPARAGELIRAVYIGKKENISNTSLLGTILIERVFDGLVIVGFLIASSLFLEMDSDKSKLVNSIILLGGIIFGGALFIVTLGAKYRNKAELFFALLIRHFPTKMSQKSQTVVSDFLDALSILRAHKNLSLTLVYSVLVWLTEGLVFFLALIAFQLPANPLIACFTLAIVNLGMLVPSAPAGIGIFQAGNILAFSFFGITVEKALSYSIVVHFIMIVPITVIGLFLLNKDGFKPWRLRSGSKTILI